ncbi:MAG: hypothetical protein WC391_06840 [Methanoregula sp.]
MLVLTAGMPVAMAGDGNTPRAPSLSFPVNDKSGVYGPAAPVLPRISLWDPRSVPRFYRETVPPGISRQWIDLSWNNPDNPYTVVVYAPDTVFGPFQNTDNGFRNGRIFLLISSEENLAPGTWYYQIRAGWYGNDTFRIYQNSGAAEP